MSYLSAQHLIDILVRRIVVLDARIERAVEQQKHPKNAGRLASLALEAQLLSLRNDHRYAKDALGRGK